MSKPRRRAPVPARRPATPDAHGQAALLLVESLIHTLAARSIVPLADAIETVTVAIDARIDIVVDRGDADDTADRAVSLLAAIRSSLAIDAR